MFQVKVQGKVRTPRREACPHGQEAPEARGLTREGHDLLAEGAERGELPSFFRDNPWLEILARRPNNFKKPEAMFIVLSVDEVIHVEELQDLTELGTRLDLVACVELKPDSAWPIRLELECSRLNKLEAIGVAIILLESIRALSGSQSVHEHALDIMRRLEILAEEV